MVKAVFTVLHINKQFILLVNRGDGPTAHCLIRPCKVLKGSAKLGSLNTEKKIIQNRLAVYVNNQSINQSINQ